MNKPIDRLVLLRNEDKIRRMLPIAHAYCYVEWREWTGNNYIKSYYDVLLPTGEIIEHAWPNGGTVGGYASDVKVRLSSTLPDWRK